LLEFQHLPFHLNVPVADNNVDVGGNTLLQQILQFLTVDAADTGWLVRWFCVHVWVCACGCIRVCACVCVGVSVRPCACVYYKSAAECVSESQVVKVTRGVQHSEI